MNKANKGFTGFIVLKVHKHGKEEEGEHRTGR